MEKNFYEISAGGTMLREGSYLDIQRSLVYRGERADFTPFLNVPLKELEKQLKASKVEEQKIYDQLKEAAEAWDKHGAQTLLLEKAIEYLKVPEVKHTANEWKQQEDGSWEISNLVYKMTFSIVKFGDEWKLTWELSYTAPGLSVGYWGYTRSPRQRIEYEGSKKYKTLEGAQKYIQSKFDQYADHFETLSPRIPKEANPFFSVNGQLLQGYAVMRQVKKESITLEDLMGSVEVIVFPRDYENNRDLLTEDEKLFIRGRVSLGDEPVGKLVCEQVIPFDAVPRQLWLQFEDKEIYQAMEGEILGILKESEGPDSVVIYLKKERAKKILPANWKVEAAGELMETLICKLGEKNVKLVEKNLINLGK